MSTDDILKNVRLDTRMESYKSFFDHPWSIKILDSAKGTPVEQIAFDLCMSWKAAANTQHMLYLTVHNLVVYDRGVIESGIGSQSEFVTAVLSALSEEHLEKIPKDVYNSVKTVLRRIAKHVRKQMPYVPTFPADKIWAEYMTNGEFRLAVWGSQRLVYDGIYFAYEDFLVRCYKLLTGDNDFRIRDAKHFSTELRDKFSPALRDICWSEHIQTVRAVRNALVHNGGRLTEELRKMKHSIELVGDELQMMPEYSRELFGQLKLPAETMVRDVVSRPQFALQK